jgi:hypothetical protein
LSHDVGRLDELLAADFLIVDVSTGGLANRADFLAAIEARLVSSEAIATSSEEAAMREYPAAAIVIGTTA